MKLVNSLILVGPLQIQLNLLHQGQAVGAGDVKLLWLGDAVLLHSEHNRAEACPQSTLR